MDAAAGPGPSDISHFMAEEKRCMRGGRSRKLWVFSAICILIVLKVFLLSLDSSSDEFLEQRYIQKSWVLQPVPFDTAAWNISGLPVPLTQRHNPHLDHISCPALFSGDQAELKLAQQYMAAHQPVHLSDEDIISLTSNCQQFHAERGYFMQPLSEEEAAFPLAFSILMYKDLHQIERLLRAIYQPQNFYCIHVDQKASDVTRAAVHSLAECFPNMFMASQSESVFWGHISIVYAEMNCLRDLLKFKWKYFLNLSGQMFPLHTNRELVKILSMYNGANDIEGTYKRSSPLWLRVRQMFSWRLYKSLDTMLITLYPKGNPPHNVTIYKGSNQAAMSYAMAVYFMNDPRAKDLVDWFADTLAPDEYIWPTLNHNPHLSAPGAYSGDPESKPFTARVSIWLPLALQMHWSWDHWDCQGKWVREICIFGVGDLPWLQQRPELFANKFYSTVEWLAYDCMEQLIFNRTIAGDSLEFDTSYYQSLPFVKHPELVVRPGESQATQVLR